jgi:hypothetical protein
LRRDCTDRRRCASSYTAAIWSPGLRHRRSVCTDGAEMITQLAPSLSYARRSRTKELGGHAAGHVNGHVRGQERVPAGLWQQGGHVRPRGRARNDGRCGSDRSSSIRSAASVRLNAWLSTCCSSEAVRRSVDAQGPWRTDASDSRREAVRR